MKDIVCLTCSTGHAIVTGEILTAVLPVEFPIISTCKKASLRYVSETNRQIFNQHIQQQKFKQLKILYFQSWNIN